MPLLVHYSGGQLQSAIKYMEDSEVSDDFTGLAYRKIKFIFYFIFNKSF